MTRSPRTALWLTLAGVAALAMVWTTAAFTAPGHWFDDAVLAGFVAVQHGPLTRPAELIAATADPAPFLLLTVLLVVVALRNGRVRHAVLIPVILVGASSTTQILKPALAHERFAAILGKSQIGAGSWPSGHSTAAMALALCAVLAVRADWRPVTAALGGAYAVAVGFAVIILGWHFPSDVLGGYLMAGTWTALGLAALRASQIRWPARSGREAAVRLREALAPTALLAGAGVVVAAATALARPTAVAAFADEHTAALAGGAGIALLGGALVCGLVAALRS
jgi:membrane-associated phospholipid phosphatase